MTVKSLQNNPLVFSLIGYKSSKPQILNKGMGISHVLSEQNTDLIHRNILGTSKINSLQLIIRVSMLHVHFGLEFTEQQK